MDLPEGFHNDVIETRENTLSDTNSIKSRVSISPLKFGESSFKTHVLIQASPSKLIYKPRIFDKQQGLYYATYQFKLHKSRRQQTKDYLSLKSIVAIQIIGEYVQSDDGSYKSFELNLVLDDASRRNVVDHGNLKSIIKDAEMLSAFLNIPIWHAGSNNN